MGAEAASAKLGDKIKRSEFGRDIFGQVPPDRDFLAACTFRLKTKALLEMTLFQMVVIGLLEV